MYYIIPEIFIRNLDFIRNIKLMYIISQLSKHHCNILKYKFDELNIDLIDNIPIYNENMELYFYRFIKTGGDVGTFMNKIIIEIASVYTNILTYIQEENLSDIFTYIIYREENLLLTNNLCNIDKMDNILLSLGEECLHIISKFIRIFFIISKYVETTNDTRFDIYTYLYNFDKTDHVYNILCDKYIDIGSMNIFNSKTFDDV